MVPLENPAARSIPLKIASEIVDEQGISTRVRLKEVERQQIRCNTGGMEINELGHTTTLEEYLHGLTTSVICRIKTRE
ncbi:hypothetical protein ACEQ8H_007457 [Pleosporales sp. CAS-2024a]